MPVQYVAMDAMAIATARVKDGFQSHVSDGFFIMQRPGTLQPNIDVGTWKKLVKRPARTEMAHMTILEEGKLYLLLCDHKPA